MTKEAYLAPDEPRPGANPEDHHYCESCPLDSNKTGVFCGATWPRGERCLQLRHAAKGRK